MHVDLFYAKSARFFFEHEIKEADHMRTQRLARDSHAADLVG